MTTVTTDLAAAADLREGTYAEFLYGRGEVPGLDLGLPLAYGREGALYRQRFERGLTLANVGDVPVEVTLGPGYRTLDGTPRCHVVVPPRSAEILVS